MRFGVAVLQDDQACGLLVLSSISQEPGPFVHSPDPPNLCVEGAENGRSAVWRIMIGYLSAVYRRTRG